MKDKRLENLKPFKKGDDPRRSKKGKGKQILTKILDEMSEELEENSSFTHKEIIAKKLIDLAKKGDIRAIQLFIERTEGKEVSKIEIKDTSENPNWDIELV